MLRHVVGLAVRRPVLVLLAGIALAVTGFVVGIGALGHLSTQTGTVPGSDSARGSDVVDQASAGRQTLTAVLADRSMRDPALAASLDAAVAQVRTLPGVTDATRPLVAADGRAALVLVTLDGGDRDRTTAAEAVARRLDAVDPPHVTVTGGPLTGGEFSHQALDDVRTAETLTTPVVLALLVLVFGGLLAATMPLLVAAVGVGGAFGLLYVFSFVADVSVYAIQIVTMLAVGLGVDYALLIVNRFREERTAARDDGVDDAVLRAALTAGRTVLFSGLMVSISLAGLAVFPDPFLRSMGIAGASVVVVDMIAALTMLPALLALVGGRIRPARRPEGPGVFHRLAVTVQRRPLATAGAVCAVLVALMVPMGGLRLGGIDPQALPARTETRAQYEALVTHFPQLTGPDPVRVVVPAGATDPAVPDLQRRIRTVPGVRQVGVDPVSPTVTVLRAEVAATPGSGEAARLVADVRALPSPRGTLVTGRSARLVDHRAMLGRDGPWAALIILVATFVVLFWFTGSVLLPVKAIVTSMLSIGAALGVTLWIFQDGHLAGWFGAVGLGATDSMVPVLVSAVAFGLSVDYEVFLLSRVRERWLAGSAPGTAIAEGLQDTGRIITSAALLLMIVFAGFVAGGFVPIQEIGLGLLLSVFLDASLVRIVLVPATMTVLDRYNWWAPAPLAALHRRLSPGIGYLKG